VFDERRSAFDLSLRRVLGLMRRWIRISACAFLVSLQLCIPDYAAASTLLAAKATKARSRPRPLPLHIVRALVDKYAQKYGIPLTIARKLVMMESGYKQHVVSRVGARGVMQLRPSTARGLRVNIYDTEQNIEGGMRYLRHQYNVFRRWDLALAAYHSGPGNVRRYKGVPPMSRNYVRAILGKIKFPPPGPTASKPKTARKPAAAPRPEVVPVTEKVVEPAMMIRRRIAMETGDSHSTVVETLERGQLTARTVQMLITDGNQTIRITREFRMVDGVWVMVSQRTVVRSDDGNEVEEQDSDRGRRADP
jgi:hypothetical protein